MSAGIGPERGPSRGQGNQTIEGYSGMPPVGTIIYSGGSGNEGVGTLDHLAGDGTPLKPWKDARTKAVGKQGSSTNLLVRIAHAIMPEGYSVLRYIGGNETGQEGIAREETQPPKE